MPGCSGIKAANQLIQLENREIVLDYLGEPIVITRVFKSGRERERGRSMDQVILWEKDFTPFLVSQVEKGKHPCQGMQGASRSWKQQENGFSPRDSRKEPNPAAILILARETHAEFLTYRTV